MVRQAFAWVSWNQHTNEEEQRRGQNLQLLLITLSLSNILSLPFMLLDAQTAPTAWVPVVLLGIYMFGFFASRRGYVVQSGLGVIFFGVVFILITAIGNSDFLLALNTLILFPLIAGLCLPPNYIWGVLGFIYTATTVSLLFLPQNPFNSPHDTLWLVIGAILLFGATLMIYLGSLSTERALRAARAARAQADATAQALAASNETLESTVVQRTAELGAALAESRARSEQQAKLLAELEQQRATIYELGTPVIAISQSTLIMPLIGTLDTVRIEQIQQEALRELETSSARNLILDITGVPIVDTHVAKGILTVVHAARLLGAQVLLVGIRPEVAQALVGLGVDLGQMYTSSSLRSALDDLKN